MSLPGGDHGGWGAVGLAVAIIIGGKLGERLIDLFLPKDRHLRLLDRFTEPDDPADEPKESP